MDHKMNTTPSGSTMLFGPETSTQSIYLPQSTKVIAGATQDNAAEKVLVGKKPPNPLEKLQKQKKVSEKNALNPMRKKAHEKSLKIPENHDVGSDAVENGNAGAAGDSSPDLLLVQCVPTEEPEKSVLASPSSALKKLPIPRANAASTEMQYYLLCPTPVTQASTTISLEQPDPDARSVTRKPRRPGARWKCALCSYRPSAGTDKARSVFRFPKDDLRQKMWIKVCLEIDEDFKLRRESFVCEEHFTTESFGVPRVQNGVETKRLQWFAVPSLGAVKKDDRRNCDAASEADEDMEIEEEILEYDNGLPTCTALDLPSGLPNTKDCEQRLLFEEGKENICENISCSTCGVSQEPCWGHAKFIKDKNTNPLALISLPRQLDFKFNGNEDSPLGVLSRGSLSSHTVFGPLRGALCSHISSRFAVSDSATWKCYHLESDDTCNWMKYVQFADDAEDQNLAVFVKERQIFFVTTRDIQPDEELKIWYSRKYADGLGFARKDQLHNTGVYEDGMSVADDGISEKDDDEVDFADTGENDLPLMDFDEIGMQDAVHDIKELSHDSALHRTSQRSGRVKRKKTAASIDEKMASGTGREATPVPGHTVMSEEQLMNLPDLHATFDANSSENTLKSPEDVPSAEPEESDRISDTGHKKVKSGPAKRGRPRKITFGCAECRLQFPTEHILLLHNYQHSDVSNSEERTCPKCGTVFDDLGGLSLHVKEHGQKYSPKEKCAHCDALVVCSTMAQHLWRQHPEQSGPSTGRYPCSKCGIEFDSLTAYREHTADHRLRVECLYCGITEISGVAMGQHLILHKEQDGFRCPKCSKAFVKYHNLKNHYDTHNRANPRKKAKDADGKEETKGLPQIKRKNRKVSKFFVDPSTRIKFPCPICRKSYKTEPLLEIHRRFHETESDKAYQGDDIEKVCPECGEEFDTLDALFRHVEGYGVSFFARAPCPVCKKFISAYLMQRHIEGNHPSEQAEKSEQFPCEVCKKVFPSEIKHRAHFQMHKPKKCLLCAAIFEGWIPLGRHAVSTHKQADGFHCPNCEAVFGTFRRLTNHHRNHHDIRSIVSCEICGKMCKSKAVLYGHMKIEHGSKEFTHECAVCHKKFMRHGSLGNHFAWAHTAVGRKKVQDNQVAFMKKGYVAPRKRMLLEEFPFKCETCQVGFLTEGRILRHNVKFHPPDEA